MTSHLTRNRISLMPSVIAALTNITPTLSKNYNAVTSERLATMQKLAKLVRMCYNT